MSIPIFEFLKTSPIPLHYKQPENNRWVFWRQNYNGSENNSSSADLVTAKIHDMIISAFSDIEFQWGFLGQFWAPITVGNRRLLSTSGQPFVVGYPILHNEISMYRLYSENFKYNIDVNKLDLEGDHMIISGGPDIAFLNSLPCMNQLQWLPSSWAFSKFNLSIMLPICLPSQSSCIGVIEVIIDRSIYDSRDFILNISTAVKKNGLDVFDVQGLMPYKTIAPSEVKCKTTPKDFREEVDGRSEAIVIESATHIEDDETREIGEIEMFSIFQGKRSPPMVKAPEEGKKRMAEDYKATSKVTCSKTTPKMLPREVIEKQFGKTMKEAAKNLNVSLSTFKRKFKELGMLEWPGPNFVKRTTNDSSFIPVDTNEKDNGAIHEPSTVMQLTIKDTHEDNGAVHEPSTVMQLTIKAEYANDMIKFRLPISQVSFVIIEKIISSKFNLCLGTYKLKYVDEVGDLILLTSDEELSYCIESSRKLDPNEVRLHVLPYTQPKCGPSCSYGIGSAS